MITDQIFHSHEAKHPVVLPSLILSIVVIVSFVLELAEELSPLFLLPSLMLNLSYLLDVRSLVDVVSPYDQPLYPSRNQSMPPFGSGAAE